MSTYDSYEPRSNFGLFVATAFVVAALVAGGVYFLQKDSGDDQADSGEPRPVEKVVEEAPAMPPGPEDPFETGPDDPEMKADTVVPATPEQTLVDLGVGVVEFDPNALLKKIGETLESGKFEEAVAMIGRDALDERHIKGLQDLSASGTFRLHAVTPVSEIGELEANRRSRWALNLDSESGARIYFDLLRGQTGKWEVEKIKIPDPVTPGVEPPRADFVLFLKKPNTSFVPRSRCAPCLIVI